MDYCFITSAILQLSLHISMWTVFFFFCPFSPALTLTDKSHLNYINEKLQRFLECIDVGLGDPVLTPGSRISVVCGDSADHIAVTAGTVCVI